MSSSSQEKELLNGLINGKDAAYEQIYRDYFGMIMHFVLKNSGDEEEAKDIFQEGVIGLLKLVRKEDFELSASIKTLIYSICRNLWLKKLREQKKKGNIEDIEKVADIEDETEVYDSSDQVMVLKKCIESLGEPCKTLLVQFYFMKASMMEIAEELGYKTSDHAKAQKYKCLKRLKEAALPLLVNV